MNFAFDTNIKTPDALLVSACRYYRRKSVKKSLILPLLLMAGFISQGASAAVLFLKQGGQACTNSLSANPQKYVGYASVPKANGTFSLVIDNPAGGATNCTNLPVTTTPLSVTVNSNAQIIPISFFKNGECLEQGDSFVGVTGFAPAPLPAGIDVVRFGFQLVNNGCPAAEPTFNRPVSIRSNNNTVVFTGTYHLYNENSVPEPGSLALLGLGAGALFFAMRRKSGRKH